MLHADGIPAGAFGDWRSGISETWHAERERPFTLAERTAVKRHIEKAKGEAEVERNARQVDAAKKAKAIWQAAQPAADDHPYLTRKGVKATATLREINVDQAVKILGYRPQARGEALAGRLLVAPVKVGDAVSTCELIDEAGRKSAIYGGGKAGGYWAAQPLPEGGGEGLTLLIGEGVATVLSANEATGYPSIAALSCGNLLSVARVMRNRYQKASLVILADWATDRKTPKRPRDPCVDC